MSYLVCAYNGVGVLGAARTMIELRWLMIACLVVSQAAIGLDFSGFLAAETRFFTQAPLHPAQVTRMWSPSVFTQPEFRHDLNGGQDRLTAIPFFRVDAYQSSRTHFDLRELNWLHRGDDWDLRVGFGKVFWGVTESRHLVDIVNQTDLLEDVDEDSKLGQPMVNLNLSQPWGNLSLFVLPAFRERTFIGRKDRFRYLLPVDDSHPVYESSLKYWHPDLAARWSKTFGDWDIGISQFWGTGREPRLVVDPVTLTLIPNYDIITQTGMDVQAALGKWLLKLEAITRGGQGKRFGAVVGGFEYTFNQIFGTTTDLGVLAEYIYDGRDWQAPPTAFKNDVFVGFRLNLNDSQSSEMLLGAIVDRNWAATVLSLEGSRRIGEKWKLGIEARIFENTSPTDLVLYGLRQDAYLQLRLYRYF